MKKEITKETVFEIEPYRSIINLLLEIKKLENDIRDERHKKFKDGIEQKHFRYVLIKDHDKENLHKWTYKGLKCLFGDKLKKSIENGYIKEGCITSRNSLTNFLDRLLKMKVIKKKRDRQECHHRFI